MVPKEHPGTMAPGEWAPLFDAGQMATLRRRGVGAVVLNVLASARLYREPQADCLRLSPAQVDALAYYLSISR